MTARGISPHSEAHRYPYDSPYADISLFGGFRAERLEAVNGAGKPGKVSQVVLGVVEEQEMKIEEFLTFCYLTPTLESSL